MGREWTHALVTCLLRNPAYYINGTHDHRSQELRSAALAAEEWAAERAATKVAELQAEHDRYTRNWVHATDQMQAVLMRDLNHLEGELAE
jgi:hypothetical protein